MRRKNLRAALPPPRRVVFLFIFVTVRRLANVGTPTRRRSPERARVSFLVAREVRRCSRDAQGSSDRAALGDEDARERGGFDAAELLSCQKDAPATTRARFVRGGVARRLPTTGRSAEHARHARVGVVHLARGAPGESPRAVVQV